MFQSIVYEDFSGLTEAINNMSKQDAKEFNKKLSQVRLLDDFDKALSQFIALCEKYKAKYLSFINHILGKKEHYFNFIKYPEAIRKHIYTTNIAENPRSRLEVIRINS